jgi:hypothetical protein
MQFTYTVLCYGSDLGISQTPAYAYAAQLPGSRDYKDAESLATDQEMIIIAGQEVEDTTPKPH